MPILTVGSDRIFGITILNGTTTEAASIDYSPAYTLPTNFGDCLILGWQINVSALGTPVANPETRGPLFRVLDPGATTVVDICDDAQSIRWRRVAASQLAASGAPDTPALFRTNETLQILAAFESTTGTPALNVAIRVKRLRQLGG
jgi:hypothetical protein